MAVATPLEPASKATPCSILLPCSSLPKPIKTQAGERKLGWLAAPPRELTLPRPIAPVVDDNDIEIEQGPLPESLCPTSVSQDDFDSSTASSTVPSSSPSASQESVETSATSATSASGPEPSDKMPTFSALQRSGSISVADATRPQWDRKDSDGQSTPRSSSTPRSVSSRAGPNTAIRFSTLPERPPELRRRNSITLGVLARKNMLSAQGTYNPTPMGQGASGMSGGSGFSKVYMTDEEWQAYQEKFAKKTGANQPVDIGAVMSSGAKKIFGKLRRGSNASVTSNTSADSTSSNRARSDSNPLPVSPKVSAAVCVEPALVEEDEPCSAPGSPRCLDAVSTEPGDETPRRPRSPAPVQQFVYDDEQVQEQEDVCEEDTQSRPARRNVENDVLHQHNPSSVAALGFELDNYKGRPWERTNGQSGGAVSS